MANYFYELPEELIQYIYSFHLKEVIQELEQIKLIQDNFKNIVKTPRVKFVGLIHVTEFKKAEKFCPLFKYTDCAIRANVVLRIWNNHHRYKGKMRDGHYPYFPAYYAGWYEFYKTNITRMTDGYDKYPIEHKRVLTREFVGRRVFTRELVPKDNMIQYLINNNQKVAKSWTKKKLLQMCLAF